MENKNLSRSKPGVFSNYIPGKDGNVSILLYGEVGDKEKVDPMEIVSQLLELSNRYKAISVHINSNGGDVFAGIAIFNALKSSDADITIYVDGVAASIAGVIALCGKKLYMNQYARLMIHNVSGGCYGSKSDLQDMISCIENLEDTIADMISKRCKKSKEEITALYFDGKDHWITAKEALSMGLIDGITETKEEVPENGTTDDIYNYFNNKFMNSNSIAIGLKTDIQNAYNKGFISQSDYDYLNSLKDENTDSIKQYLNKKYTEFRAVKSAEYDQLVKDNWKIFNQISKDFVDGPLKELALNDLDTFKAFVPKATPKKLLKDLFEQDISNDGSKPRGEWTLTDYRKFAPKELERNPALYNRLLEQEKLRK